MHCFASNQKPEAFVQIKPLYIRKSINIVLKAFWAMICIEHDQSCHQGEPVQHFSPVTVYLSLVPHMQLRESFFHRHHAGRQCWKNFMGGLGPFNKTNPFLSHMGWGVHCT